MFFCFCILEPFFRVFFDGFWLHGFCVLMFVFSVGVGSVGVEGLSGVQAVWGLAARAFVFGWFGFLLFWVDSRLVCEGSRFEQDAWAFVISR